MQGVPQKDSLFVFFPLHRLLKLLAQPQDGLPSLLASGDLALMMCILLEIKGTKVSRKVS